MSALNAYELRAELERSRESSARLLDSLARKVGSQARGVAQYVQNQSVKDAASGIERAVRSRPATAMALAVVAGYLVGRSVRSR